MKTYGEKSLHFSQGCNCINFPIPVLRNKNSDIRRLGNPIIIILYVQIVCAKQILNIEVFSKPLWTIKAIKQDLHYSGHSLSRPISIQPTNPTNTGEKHKQET